MRNIVQMIGSKDFSRIKIGIGGIKHQNQDLKDFVLEKFNSSQREELKEIFKLAYEKFIIFLDN